MKMIIWCNCICKISANKTFSSDFRKAISNDLQTAAKRKEAALHIAEADVKQ